MRDTVSSNTVSGFGGIMLTYDQTEVDLCLSYVHALAHTHIHTHTMYVYIYIYIER